MQHDADIRSPASKKVSTEVPTSKASKPKSKQTSDDASDDEALSDAQRGTVSRHDTPTMKKKRKISEGDVEIQSTTKKSRVIKAAVNPSKGIKPATIEDDDEDMED